MNVNDLMMFLDAEVERDVNCLSATVHYGIDGFVVKGATFINHGDTGKPVLVLSPVRLPLLGGI